MIPRCYWTKRVDSTLAAYRNKLLGNIPKHRNDFKPESLPSKMEGGDKILEMDSSRNLPNNWQDLDMKKEFGISESPIDLTEVSVLSLVGMIEKLGGS